MPIRIELFGLARRRVGLPVIEVEARTLGEALREALAQQPGLGDCCTPSGQLRATFVANLNGRRFVTQFETPLEDGDAVLLLSADAGG